MKTKQVDRLPFGDVVVAEYQVWGKDLAAKMVRLAIKARLVVFQTQPPFMGFPVKGRSV
jgi:hypothetical protein